MGGMPTIFREDRIFNGRCEFSEAGLIYDPLIKVSQSSLNGERRDETLLERKGHQPHQGR
jgi:hypothetical protein